MTPYRGQNVHDLYSEKIIVVYSIFKSVCKITTASLVVMIIDKQGGEGLETHYTYICTLTVIGAFL